MLRSSAIILGLCLLATACAAQFGVYKTYADFVANDAWMYDGYTVRDFENERKNMRIRLVSADGLPDVIIACEEIWGFRFDSALYRIEPEMMLPARLIFSGKPCYFENGAAHLRMQLQGTDREEVQWGSGGYLAHELNSEMIYVPLHVDDYGRSGTKKFLQSRPEYEVILKCLNGFYQTNVVRGCIVWQQQQAGQE
jgi:hypothetical protein